MSNSYTESGQKYYRSPVNFWLLAEPNAAIEAAVRSVVERVKRDIA